MTLAKRYSALLTAAVACCVFGAQRVSAASSHSIELRFDPQTVQIERIGDYERVFLPGLEIVAHPGEPSLPVRVLRVLVDGRWDSVSVEAQLGAWHKFGPGHRILPRQQPQILSFSHGQPTEAELRAGNPEIYESDSPFPAPAARCVESKPIGEKTLLTLWACPFQYVPKTGELRLAQEVNLRLRAEVRDQKTSTAADQGSRWTELLPIVDYDFTGGRDLSAEMGIPSPLPAAEYVVVTQRSFLAAFEPLIRWKNEKGITARAVSTEWIYRNFTGADPQEKIRSFLKFASREWGTRWALLGGDTFPLYHRCAFAMDCEANYAPGENDIPCDLYFADLDGDWNADGDSIYGEVADEVDGYSDVYVGRAPVQSIAEVETFVRKTLAYERAAKSDYQLRILFLGEILWRNPYTDSGEGKNLIDLLYVPPRFDPITKLYESLGNESVSSVVQAMNQGYNLVNHDGHAWHTVMGVGEGYLRKSDARNLRNGDRLFLLYSIGCWPAAFDYECIAEEFVNNPDGGAFAFIGNSRYGWGSPGNPHFGYSDRFDQQFYRFVFHEHVHQVGRALALAKAYYVPFARQENVYRWCEYEINLLGDPEVPLWTDTPRELVVEHADTLAAGAPLFSVLVRSDGAPIPGARVALSQNGVLKGRSFTDAAGFATVRADSVEPGTPARLVVTGPNLKPYVASLVVEAADAYLVLSGRKIEDAHPDDALNPGTTASLLFQVKNVGSSPSSGGIAQLFPRQDWTQIRTDTASLPVLSPGDSAWVGPFELDVDTTATDGDAARFTLALPTDSLQVALPVGEPRLFCRLLGLEDTPGGGEGVLEPGEAAWLHLAVYNGGLGSADSLRIYAGSLSPHLTVLSPEVRAGNAPPGDSLRVALQVELASSAEPVGFHPVWIRLEAWDGGYTRLDTLLITAGRTGFRDDCESFAGWDSSRSNLGAPGWTISQYRVHSGESSFYCGDPEQHSYVTNQHDSLVTRPFVVGQRAYLSFWCWFDVAIYGVDGLYVRVESPEGWRTLDFIGSGGALGPALMGNDWLEYRYDLSFLSPGTTTRLCFKFVSDGDTQAEGVYIDDVRVASPVERYVTGVPGKPQADLPRRFALRPPYPNPFNSSVRIEYELPEATSVEVSIYDALGRQVRGFRLGRQSPGIHRVQWDGNTDFGVPVPSGVYLVRLRTRFGVATKKLLLLR